MLYRYLQKIALIGVCLHTGYTSFPHEEPGPSTSPAALFRLSSVEQATAKKSFDTIHQEALAGDPEAQFSTGVRYYLGKGVAKNRDLAKEWFEKASTKGQRSAWLSLCFISPQVNHHTDSESPLAKIWFAQLARHLSES